MGVESIFERRRDLAAAAGDVEEVFAAYLAPFENNFEGALGCGDEMSTAEGSAGLKTGLPGQSG